MSYVQKHFLHGGDQGRLIGSGSENAVASVSVIASEVPSAACRRGVTGGFALISRLTQNPGENERGVRNAHGMEESSLGG